MIFNELKIGGDDTYYYYNKIGEEIEQNSQNLINANEQIFLILDNIFIETFTGK